VSTDLCFASSFSSEVVDSSKAEVGETGNAARQVDPLGEAESDEALPKHVFHGPVDAKAPKDES
jgi:hypothetical protein